MTDAKSKIDQQTEKRNRILTDANSKSDPQVKTGKAGTTEQKIIFSNAESRNRNKRGVSEKPNE